MYIVRGQLRSNMQTLGLSDSTPRSESRLKSLFWPSIRTASDVDYIGVQGYWLCTILAVASFVFLTAARHPLIGAVMLPFFYVGGVGIREHSRYAATIVLVVYVADSLASFPLILGPQAVGRAIFAALLLSNFRATWITSRWKPETKEATPPPRLAETWTDKFEDRLPSRLWPGVRVPYYVLSGSVLLLYGIGLAVKWSANSASDH